MSDSPRICRRVLLRGMSLGVMSAGITACAMTHSFAAASKPRTRDDWMKAWLNVTPKDPEGELIMFRFKDPIYVLNQPIAWKRNEGQSAALSRVDVPKGFVTDLASIPAIFWTLLRPDGEYAYPAIVHDFLYWMQTTTRAEADEIFRLGMQDFDVGKATVETIYRAVRAGGESAWSGNARLKAQGEKRILVRIPKDPRITWAEWKRTPGVFEP